jgi:hypothetical protein
MHKKKTYRNLNHSITFAGSILNFKLFFHTVGFTNFGRATEEMSHFIVSKVS